MKRIASLARAICDSVIVITFAMLVGGLIGQLARDRWLIIAPLMYFPVPLIAVLAILIDLIKRGRTLRGLRYSLSVIAILSLAIETRTLFGFGAFDQPISNQSTIRVMHWNVMWGGGFHRPVHWDDICKKILDRKPDIAVLSEVPIDDTRMQQLMQKLGDGWAEIPFNHGGSDGYISRMRVISRYNMQIEKRYSNGCGTVAIVRIDSPKVLRFLLVDGVSGINDKQPLYEMIRSAIGEEQMIDAVLGDFNSTTRNIGFSSLQALGYREATDFDFTYRGTWPAKLPIYGIDHMLIAPKHRILNARSFRSRGSDHRGLFVDLQFVD